MKKTIFLLFLVAVAFGCRRDIEGPQGPQGPEGPPGRDAEIPYVWEVSNINFTHPDYTIIWEFGNFDVFDSDIVLVYFLWAVEEIGGQPYPVWKPLPITLFDQDGIVHYSFDFTVLDVAIEMQATNANLFRPQYTDDWTARIVLLPAEFVNSAHIDFDDYNDVAAKLGLPENPVKVTIQKK
jgi:hypothetical protein